MYLNERFHLWKIQIAHSISTKLWAPRLLDYLITWLLDFLITWLPFTSIISVHFFESNLTFPFIVLGETPPVLKIFILQLRRLSVMIDGDDWWWWWLYGMVLYTKYELCYLQVPTSSDLQFCSIDSIVEFTPSFQF